MARDVHSSKYSAWKKLSTDPASCVDLIHQKIHLSFPPYYLENIRKSLQSVIEQRLTRFEPQLNGILAGYGNIAILQPWAEILFNLSDIHIDVEGDFYIFNPKIGSRLKGTINKKSAGFIGCLVHGLFNISLPKPFALPAKKWLGSSANLHDEVIFTITDVDFQSPIPYIQGNIEEICPYHVASDSIHDRTFSDSGVSIESEEAPPSEITSIYQSPKRQKFSSNSTHEEEEFSTKKKSSKKQNDIFESTEVFTVDNGNELEFKKNKKRKRDPLSDSIVDDKPKKKKHKIKEEKEDKESDIHELVGELFQKMAQKLTNNEESDTCHKQKRKKKKSSVNDSSFSELTVNNLVPSETVVNIECSPDIPEVGGKQTKVKKVKEKEEMIRELLYVNSLSLSPEKGSSVDQVKKSKSKTSKSTSGDDKSPTKFPRNDQLNDREVPRSPKTSPSKKTIKKEVASDDSDVDLRSEINKILEEMKNDLSKGKDKKKKKKKDKKKL